MRQDAPSLRPMFSLVFPLFLFFISSSSYSYKIIITHHHSYTLTIHPSTPVFDISLAAFDVEIFDSASYHIEQVIIMNGNSTGTSGTGSTGSKSESNHGIPDLD